MPATALPAATSTARETAVCRSPIHAIFATNLGRPPVSQQRDSASRDSHLRASYRRSQAAFAEAAGQYQQQVLVAFGDVEDSLSAIHFLADQAAAQARAVEHSRRSADLATQRYTSGIVSYLEVVDASRDALQSERSAAQLFGQRLIADVQLIKSLGGGWTEQRLMAQANPRSRP